MADTKITGFSGGGEASSLEQLREQHEAAELALKTRQMELKLQAIPTLSGTPIQEAWAPPFASGVIQPNYADDFERGGLGANHPQLGAMLGDRAHGQLRPIFETEEQLAEIRAMGRVIEQNSPSARCALKNLVNYTLGTGLSYKMVSDSADVLRATQCVLDDFLKRARWVGRREREAYRRAVRDGETFLGLFHIGGGRAAVRFIEPEQVSAPTSPREIEDWLGIHYPSDWWFGIHTAEDDVESRYGYYVQWSNRSQDFDYLPEYRVQHIKRNVDGNIKRGLSDFYPVFTYLEEAAKLLRNVVSGASVMAAIAWIKEHAPGVSQSQVEDLRGNNDDYTYNRTTGNQGSKRVHVQKYYPGTVVSIPAGEKYLNGPLANRGIGDTLVVIEQAVLRVVGSNWCMPEYLISADASNSNYASTMVAESPWVKYCESEQEFTRQEYMDLLWKVHGIACEAGRYAHLGINTVEQLQQVCELSIEAPRVTVRNAKEETDRRDLLSQRGLLSDETWAAQEELDYEGERAKGATRQELPAFPGLPESRGVRLAKASELLWEGYP